MKAGSSFKRKLITKFMLINFILLGLVFTGIRGEAFAPGWRHDVQEVIKKAPGKSAVYIMDLSTEQAVAFNQHEQMPSASIIKLFIIHHLFEADGGTGQLLNKTITFDASKALPGGIMQGMTDGGQFRLVDLALLMLSVSDNTATNILIDELGMAKINQSIQKLGASKTVLGRKMLDAEARKAGRDNFTSAYDTALVLKEIQKNKQMMRMLSVQKDTSKLAARLPFDDADDIEPIFAHKTGELTGVQHDAGVFFYDSQPVVVVVLTSGLASVEDGRNFSAQIGKIIYDDYQR